jgi:hypothetical protein
MTTTLVAFLFTLLVTPVRTSVVNMPLVENGFSGLNTNGTYSVPRNNVVRFDQDKLERDRQARMERQRERRERARQKLASLKPDLSTMHRMTQEELEKAAEEEHPWARRALRNKYDAYSFEGLADPSQYYDKWQQAYRMLGGYIDCDHKKDGNDHHSHDDGGGEANSYACSRWMIWASVS